MSTKLGIVSKIIPIGVAGIALTLMPALFSEDYPNSMDAAFNVPVMFVLAFAIGAWRARSTLKEKMNLGHTIAFGASLMLFYPVWGIVDAFIHPAAHTLLGVEFLVYAVFALICGIVALLGHVVVDQIYQRVSDRGKNQ